MTENRDKLSNPITTDSEHSSLTSWQTPWWKHSRQTAAGGESCQLSEFIKGQL